MKLSKSTRILILLGIDTVFFLLELVVGTSSSVKCIRTCQAVLMMVICTGYSVHSLALVADSFHMLNDVLSLCVGLWAVKVAQSKKNSKMYTYGWQRAETLGALVNGVFLVALCLSIFLEAIQRFVEPQEVLRPKLVLIVGCCGLASNILGLFLFHEHGHGHNHGHDDGEVVLDHPEARGELSAAEEGQAHLDTGEAEQNVADENGNIADVLPQNRIGNWPLTRDRSKSAPKKIQRADEDNEPEAPLRRGPSSSGKRSNVSGRRHSRSDSRGFSSLDDLYIHPASFRNEIIAASRLEDVESGSGTDAESEACVAEEENLSPTETSPLLSQQQTGNEKHWPKLKSKSLTGDADNRSNSSNHKTHRHNKSETSHTHGGHSHGDLNMRGVFLHVMGDALGNIGVIASALIIWLTSYSWRFYSDPLISLIITVIILASAIPLCQAASRILLQAVPAGINVDDIKYDINELPGIVSCHHLHVWQLSDTKLVASLHVQVEFDFKGEGSARYMALARDIRRCLHDYGIHSSTIQPEFCLNKVHNHAESANETPITGVDGIHDNSPYDGTSRVAARGSRVGSKVGSVATSLQSEPTCLLDCSDTCARSKQCCVMDDEQTSGGSSRPGSS